MSAAAHKKKEDVTARIGKLLEQHLLSRNGNFYYISNKIFKFWIITVFQYRLNAAHHTPELHRAFFRKSLQQRIEEFIKADSVNCLERILELFNLFHNESFQLNGHKYRLSNMRELKPLFATETTRCAMAHSLNASWFIFLTENDLIENDVSQLLSECQKYKGKTQRRIIITLGRIDENAKLRALGSRIWVWGAKEINSLLNLYNKPYIIK